MACAYEVLRALPAPGKVSGSPESPQTAFSVAQIARGQEERNDGTATPGLPCEGRRDPKPRDLACFLGSVTTGNTGA